MTNRALLSFISAGFSLLVWCGAGLAQTPNSSEEVIARSGVPRESVAAVVNDVVITTYDVRQRMRLMVMSAGGRIPPEALPQIQQKALRDLIEEKLKLQELAVFDVKATEQEIAQEFSMIAAQTNMSADQFESMLSSQGVSIDSLNDQIEANMLWPELVRGRYRDRVRVNEDEIEDTIQRMREEANLEQFLVSEICIAVDDPARAQEYYQGSLQLLEQMRRGVPFAVVAQQFSACTTAAVGGDLGWVRAGQLEPELDAAIRNLQPGSVSNPIPSQGAFMILALRDKRAAVVAGEPTFKLAYVSAPESVGQNTARFAFEKVATADACSGRPLRQDLGENIGFALLENMTLDSIDPRFRDWIEDLDREETSPVIKAEGAYHAAYVCDKDEGLGLPSHRAIEDQIYARQMTRISQQYLRDIERKSSIDIRLKEPLAFSG